MTASILLLGIAPLCSALCRWRVRIAKCVIDNSKISFFGNSYIHFAPLHDFQAK